MGPASQCPPADPPGGGGQTPLGEVAWPRWDDNSQGHGSTATEQTLACGLGLLRGGRQAANPRREHRGSAPGHARLPCPNPRTAALLGTGNVFGEAGFQTTDANQRHARPASPDPTPRQRADPVKRDKKHVARSTGRQCGHREGAEATRSSPLGPFLSCYRCDNPTGGAASGSRFLIFF